MAAIFDCKNCIHRKVCCYIVSVNNEDLHSCIEKLETYTTDNMSIRIECKYREEVNFNGTIKQANI